MNWPAYLDGMATLFEQGGLVLWAILLASVLLWALIFERYWFHWRQVPSIKLRLVAEWQARASRKITALELRHLRALVDDLRAESGRNLLALQALTGILPLLGLLGTVSGMIKVFEVITAYGTGNTRGMAAGISEALVTTMAGLFTALSGFYFISDLERRARKLVQRFEVALLEGK